MEQTIHKSQEVSETYKSHKNPPQGYMSSKHSWGENTFRDTWISCREMEQIAFMRCQSCRGSFFNDIGTTFASSTLLWVTPQPCSVTKPHKYFFHQVEFSEIVPFINSPWRMSDRLFFTCPEITWSLHAFKYLIMDNIQKISC